MTISKCLRLLSITFAFTLVLGGCAVVHTHPYPVHGVDIPEGHMPPPGECRIWYRDRPPGQQPPPGNCHELQQRVPPGAILIRG